MFKTNPDNIHKDSVHKAEIKLSAFFAAHNVAFSVIDQLEPLLKDIFPDSKICADLKLKRTKCTEIINNVLCKKETNDLVHLLRNENFSVLLDESTDIGNHKSLVIMTRYFNLKNYKIETRLLQLLDLDARKLGANEIYQAFVSCLAKHRIPIENIVGVASDGASVMIGRNHSFFKLLQDKVKHIILMRCICHSAALMASTACNQLPRSPEDLLRNIYNYVSGSAKRCAQLQEMQRFFNEKEYKILNLSATRWLSRYECVIRVLENWNVLEHYFIIAMQEDKLKSAELICNELKNIYTKAYLFFLKYSLKTFNAFNALFQSRQPLIHILYAECIILMKQLCKNFIIEDIVLKEDLQKIDLDNTINYLNLKDIYVGPECATLVEQMPENGKEIFLENCLKFYIAAATDLQKRLPNEIFREMQFLHPGIAFNKKESMRNVNFGILCNTFKNITEIDETQLAIEWRNLNIVFSEAEKEHLMTLPLPEMWMIISLKKSYDESLVFANLGKIAKLVLILPHSNAEVERVFSIVTDTKTKKRNRIGECSLNSVCVFRNSLQVTNDDVAKFLVTQDHLKLHTNEKYGFKTE